MGLFDSNGQGYVTQDRMGENPEIFRGYLGYEAAEGIDWIWEHRIEDMEHLGL